MEEQSVTANVCPLTFNCEMGKIALNSDITSLHVLT